MWMIRLISFQDIMQEENVAHKNANLCMNLVPRCRSEWLYMLQKYASEFVGDQYEDVMWASANNS